MEDYWSMFCGAYDSCINHALIVCFDVLLLVVYLFLLFGRPEQKKLVARSRSISSLQKIVAIFNVLLALLYLSMGIWILVSEFMENNSILPLHRWCFLCVHGLTWLLVSLTVSLRGEVFSEFPLRLLTILAFLFSIIICGFSLVTSILDKEVSSEVALYVMSAIGACLLLFYACRCHNASEDSAMTDLRALLNGEYGYVSRATPFESAGVLSKMSFWWLNPLMKKGKEKTLVDADIPKLRQTDAAGTCYTMFMDLFDKQKEVDPIIQPSVLKTILLCYGKDIFVSGFFALMKIVTLSAGPLLLNAFIKVAEGNGSFKYEGFVLAALLFCLKNLESLSQRQWYFRSRLIGLRVRSLLTAAIYKKQLRLSNAAKLMHSSGEIMNYVTVDAYRVGEFPFRFHQTWTTSLQLCLALLIIYHAVGLATIASLVVLVLTVLANTPLAKLQHKFQSKLMLAQDDRLRAVSEALVNMKVLKLYAW